MLTYLNIGLVIWFIDTMVEHLKNPNRWENLCDVCERWYYWIFALVISVIVILISIITWPVIVIYHITTIKNKE